MTTSLRSCAATNQLCQGELASAVPPTPEETAHTVGIHIVSKKRSRTNKAHFPSQDNGHSDLSRDEVAFGNLAVNGEVQVGISGTHCEYIDRGILQYR